MNNNMNIFTEKPTTPPAVAVHSISAIPDGLFSGESWSTLVDAKWNNCRVVLSKRGIAEKKDIKLRIQAFDRYNNLYYTKQYIESELKVLYSDTLVNEFAPIELARFLLSLASSLVSIVDDDGRLKVICTHGIASQAAFAARTMFIVPAPIDTPVEVVRLVDTTKG